MQNRLLDNYQRRQRNLNNGNPLLSNQSNIKQQHEMYQMKQIEKMNGVNVLFSATKSVDRQLFKLRHAMLDVKIVKTFTVDFQNLTLVKVQFIHGTLDIRNLKRNYFWNFE